MTFSFKKHVNKCSKNDEILTWENDIIKTYFKSNFFLKNVQRSTPTAFALFLQKANW